MNDSNILSSVATLPGEAEIDMATPAALNCTEH